MNVAWHGGDAERVREKNIARIGELIGVEEARPGSARAARATAAPSLEEVTLKQKSLELLPIDHPDHASDVWRISKTTYGSGVVEIRGCLGVMSRRKTDQSDTDGQRVKCVGGSDTVRLESSISRSRRTLRSRCLQLNCDHMLTLTKRGKFATVDELWKVFKEFSRLMDLMYGPKWRYVAVPELHSDGQTYHMHVGIRGFFWAGIVRKFWYRALGGKGDERGEQTPGNVDLKQFKQKRRGASGARIRIIAGYIAKYVGKGFDSGNRGRRLFSSSRGLDPDRVERWRVRDWLGMPELVGALQKLFASAGGVDNGSAYFWSRHRQDGTLMMTGFCLSTEMRA